MREIDELKVQLAAAEEVESETLSLRAGIKWREEGERSNAYFLARFKANRDSAAMHCLRVLNRVIEGSENILAVVKQFYAQLYDMKPPAKLTDSAFCDSFFESCPSMNVEQQALLARPLNIEELKEALESCKDSAPGMDGIPYSYYSMFQDPLLGLVLDSWNHSLATGSLAQSHKQSCITLLPKCGKDLTNIGNWRPISLSACDLKMITKAYANRLKKVLPDILCEAQAAYVPGRDISFNNRLLQIAKRAAARGDEDFCVVSLDAKKAFD